MPNLTLISRKSTEEEIIEETEEINLPTFDIIIHTEDSWFQDMIDEQTAAIEKIKRDHNLH